MSSDKLKWLDGCKSTGWTKDDFLKKQMAIVRRHIASCHKKFGICQADNRLKVTLSRPNKEGYEFPVRQHAIKREWID